MGYTNDTTLVPYTANLVMDSLLGVKYIYSREPITGCEQIRQDILDGISLYRNPYALPLGYAVNNLETAEDYGTNVFENQTLLCKHLSGQGDGLYTSAEIQSQDTDGNSWTSWELKVPADGAFTVIFPMKPIIQILRSTASISKPIPGMKIPFSIWENTNPAIR